MLALARSGCIASAFNAGSLDLLSRSYQVCSMRPTRRDARAAKLERLRTFGDHARFSSLRADSMKRHALTEAADASASTLHAVAKDRYPAWLETQPEAVRDWLASSRFRADVGTIAWLPGDRKSVLA